VIIETNGRRCALVALVESIASLWHRHPGNMPQLFARKSIAVLQAEAEERDVQALTPHDGLQLKRSLTALQRKRVADPT
jgi:hypothetical protein